MSGYIDTTYMAGIPARGRLTRQSGGNAYEWAKKIQKQQTGGSRSVRPRPMLATPDQMGGLSLKDVGHGLKVAWDWAKKNKPLEKINGLLDSVVPASAKSNPIYSNIRNVTGAVSKQLGINDDEQKRKRVTRQVGGKNKGGKKKKGKSKK